MSTRDRIKEYINQNGPVLPVQIAKEIDSNTLIASAHLSELVSSKELKVSSVKVGGSPLYYLPGQEESLQKYSNHLHEKEKKVYELLKAKKVLKESSLEPVVKVALRNTKDFAIPLQVNYKNKTEIFWKWYLLSNQEAEQLIKKLIVEETPTKPTEKETKPEPKEIAEKPQPIQKKEIKKSSPTKKEQQEKLVEKKEIKLPADNFTKTIHNYFTRNKIEIKEETLIRKGSEAEFIITVPSAVGPLTYYCKAKSKKRLNEGDLSAAFITGQSKKLPVLFLTKGDLTKKAKEMLEKEFKGMGVRKI